MSVVLLLHILKKILQEHLKLDLKDESGAYVSFHTCNFYRKYWREWGMGLNSACFGAHAQTTRPWLQQGPDIWMGWFI